MSRPPLDGVLLLGFGGPTRPGASVEFVSRVAAGRGLSEERILEVAKHYDLLGGISPYNELTLAQGKALGAELARRGLALPVHVGMRFWSPLLADVIPELAANGHRRLAAAVMAPFQSGASWEAYQQSAREGLARLPAGQLELEYLPPAGKTAGFLEASEQNIRRAVEERLGPAGLATAALIFTAHSIPVPAARGTPYEAQFAGAAASIAALLDHPAYTLAYQSSAGGRVPWLGPDIGEAIVTVRESGAQAVVVAPIGFYCDHVEVLYDLDVVARKTAEGVGCLWVRSETVQIHPRFISALADQVLAVAAGD